MRYPFLFKLESKDKSNTQYAVVISQQCDYDYWFGSIYLEEVLLDAAGFNMDTGQVYVYDIDIMGEYYIFPYLHEAFLYIRQWWHDEYAPENPDK